MLISRVYFLVEGREESGNDAPVLIVGLCSSHSEGLAGSGLPVAEDAAGVALEGRDEYLFGSDVEDGFLRGIGEYFFELEPPLILLMIDDACFDGSFNVDIDIAA